MNTTDAAKRCGLARVTLLRDIKQGRLPASKQGGRDWQIEEQDLQDFMSKPRQVGRPKDNKSRT